MKRLRARRIRVGAFAFTLALTSLHSPLASAQTSRDPAGAGSAFARGREAMRRGDIDAACELFAESLRFDPAPGARLNLADCEQRRGHYASARNEFVEALAALPAGDERIAFARERIAWLAPKISTLVLEAPAAMPAGVEVLRDGAKISPESFGEPVPVDPGEHDIRVRAAGHKDAVQRISVVAGERRSVVLGLGESEAKTPSIAPPAPAKPEARPKAEARPKTLEWGLVGGGGAALALGTVVGILTLDRASTVKEHCVPGCDDVGYSAAAEGRWMSIASPVSLIVGTALLGAGLYLLLHNGHAGPSSNP